MDVRPVDPRDVEVENDEPTYRATVWRPLSNGWSASTYDITGARDVHEVIDWAEEEAGRKPDSRYTLWLKVYPPVSELTLLNLTGVDPTRSQL